MALEFDPNIPVTIGQQPKNHHHHIQDDYVDDTRPAVARVHPDLRIACLGNVDSGKTSLVGTLTKFILDDGRGLARSHVLQHKHELAKGQTSAVALELLGFSDDGDEIRPVKLSGRHTRDFREIASRSSRCISLVDLCGHEQYLRTTIFGLVGHLPDMCFVVVGANAGIQKMTREHLGLCAALSLPVVIIITKIDMAPQHVMDDTNRKVARILSLAKRNRLLVQNEEDARLAADSIPSVTVAPVFRVSNTTGEGLPLLRLFLRYMANSPLAGRGVLGGGVIPSTPHSVPSATPLSTVTGTMAVDAQPIPDAEFMVDNSYVVQGVGVVVSGSLMKGTVSVGQTLLLGPESGMFRHVRVSSIHRQCVVTDIVYPGQQCTIAIKNAAKSKLEPLKRNNVRKGMVLIDEARAERAKAENPSHEIACHVFQAEVKVLHHSTTILEGYAPIIHIGTIRQSAEIIGIEFPQDVEQTAAVLRTGSTAKVTFKFSYRPEFVTIGRPLVFREGNTKGVGRVVGIVR